MAGKGAQGRHGQCMATRARPKLVKHNCWELNICTVCMHMHAWWLSTMRHSILTHPHDGMTNRPKFDLGDDALSKNRRQCVIPS